MGCKCKETAKRAEKYSDEKILERVYGSQRIISVIEEIMIRILIIILIIIVSPIVLFKIFVKILSGKKIIINVSKFITEHGKGK